jgi:hypothetical protein
VTKGVSVGADILPSKILFAKVPGATDPEHHDENCGVFPEGNLHGKYSSKTDISRKGNLLCIFLPLLDFSCSTSLLSPI